METTKKKSAEIFRWILDDWSAAILNNVSESSIPTTINFVPRKTAKRFSANMLNSCRDFHISFIFGLNAQDKILRDAPPRRIDYFGEDDLLGSGFYFEHDGSLVLFEKNRNDLPQKSIFDVSDRCAIHFPMSGLKKNATITLEAHGQGTFSTGDTLLVHDGMEIKRLASSLHCDSDLVVFKESDYEWS